MKIGIDGRYAQGDLVGVGNYIKNLVAGLSKNNFECIIFYSKEPKIKIKNATNIILNTTNRFYFEQILLPLALNRNEIDLYHATANSGLPFFSFIPFVLTIHDIIPLRFRNYFKFSRFPFLSKKLFQFNMILSSYKSRKIITISKFVKKEVVDTFKIPPSKIQVIHSGVKLANTGRLPTKLVGEKYILNQGGIDIRKNLDGLIKAFLLIKKKFPDYKLVITGENLELKIVLQSLVNKLNLEDSIFFVGYVSERTLSALVKHSSCICYPSFMEGFGMPGLEGLEAGIPVVCSNTTSFPEIMNGVAVLVNPDSCSDIAAGVISILKNKKRSFNMIKKGKILVKEFRWEQTVSETLKIYREVLK